MDSVKRHVFLRVCLVGLLAAMIEGPGCTWHSEPAPRAPQVTVSATARVTTTDTPVSVPAATVSTVLLMDLALQLTRPEAGFNAGRAMPELQWQSAPLPGQHFYWVRMEHSSGYRLDSAPLSAQHWTPALPQDKTGWWTWHVQVVQGVARDDRVVDTSHQRMFWFGALSDGSVVWPTATPGRS